MGTEATSWDLEEVGLDHVGTHGDGEWGRSGRGQFESQTGSREGWRGLDPWEG